MAEPPAPTHTAFRYMTRFRCIGGDCEASCCSSGWKIQVDKEHYYRAKRAMSGSAELRREFDAKLKRVKDSSARKNSHYALLVLQQDGRCGFFDADGLCSEQKRFGEEVLGDVCSAYPRALNVSAGRRELAGMPSCPEVARQLLLVDDAMELDEVDPALIGRELVANALGDHPKEPYRRYHDELRNLMIDLLSDRAYPLRSRLSFMAYFGHRTQSFLHRAQTELDEQRLLAEVERIQDPALRKELHEQFGRLEVDPVLATRIVMTVVKARSSVSIFGQLLGAVLAHYTPPEARSEPASSAPVSAIVQSYLAQRQKWAAFDARVDRYLENYAKNYWAREWYASSPDLLAHGIQLLTRLAVLRFMLYGHPKLQAAEHATEPERALALDQAVVSTVFTFSRAFEHDTQFTKHLRETLADAHLLTLANAACLASF